MNTDKLYERDLQRNLELLRKQVRAEQKEEDEQVVKLAHAIQMLAIPKHYR